ncbi:odorant receptor 22c-like [Anopheles stephensi]|uniref:odorant receptor 22c-like n=1 Tax=Anopheles stephensi TaxID=30069 RepID=UPI0016589754|nr:odorant receptor 22c-like [Anopheles stephensi]
MAAVKESPIDKFNRILSWQLHILRMLGLDAFSCRLVLNPLALTIFLMAGLFMVVSFYDVLVLFRGDLFGTSFVLTTIFYGFIGWARILGALAYRSKLPLLMQMTRDTYHRAVRDKRQSAILARYTGIFWRGVMLYSLMFLVGVVIASVGPALLFLYSGKKILPFGVYLPFVDPNSGTGYELNYLYQMSCILWTPPGLTATQNIYFAFILNICIQYDVLQLQLADLNQLIQWSGVENQDNAVRKKLREIIVYQRRLEVFVNTIEQVYKMQALVEVLSLTFQLVLTLYVMRTSMWPPGLILIPLCTVQLFILCVPGTLIEIKASHLTETIYGIDWHDMHQKNKRIFQLLLHRSQHPRFLTCARMAIIDLNLFLSVRRLAGVEMRLGWVYYTDPFRSQVMKKVYSIFMMLENM